MLVEFLKQLIATRGAQLLARYVGSGLAFLIGFAHINLAPADTSGFINVSVGLGVALLSILVDHVSHWLQTRADSVKKKFAPPSAVPIVILAATLIALTGCDWTKVEAYFAAAATAVATHTSVSVSVDPTTGDVTASVALKDPTTGATVTVTKDQLREGFQKLSKHTQKKVQKQFDDTYHELDRLEKDAVRGLIQNKQPCPTSSVTLPAGALIDPANPSTGPPSTAVNRIVLIGDNFPGTAAELHECVRDADKMDVAIRKYYGFHDSEIKRLTNEQCVSGNIKAAVNWAFEGIKPGDKRGVFITGHGAEDTDANGNVVDLIVTYDMVSQNRWDSSTEVTLDFWRGVLAPIPAGCNAVIIMDTCHSGGSIRPFLKTGHSIRSIDGPPVVQARVNAAVLRRSFKATVETYNCSFLAACGAGQTSEETSETGGAFTNYLIQSIATLGPQTNAAKLTSNAKILLKQNAFEQQPEAHGAAVVRPLFSETRSCTNRIVWPMNTATSAWQRATMCA